MFSSTTFIENLDRAQIEEIPDRITQDVHKFCWTDGVGSIGPKLMQKVQDKLGLNFCSAV
jgi:hypothetical protein